MIERYALAATELKAVAHPLRLAILSAVALGHESPMEVFRLLSEADPQLNLSLVSYHTTILKNQGLIEEIGTIKVRGATKHIIRITAHGSMLLQIADGLCDNPTA